MSKYTHVLSFRAIHASDDLTEIPIRLGMQAKSIGKAGEPRVSPQGRKYAPYKRSVCTIDFDSSPEGLPESLELAVAKLMPHKSFLEEKSAQGVDFEFFIGLFFEDSNPGEELGWPLLKDLGDLRISLALDMYDTEKAEVLAP